MLGRSATLDILSKSRVAVAFSEWDGYPNAVIEAAMLSDVVVSSDCDYGPREILAGRPRSYLVPSKQESELAGVLAEAAAASKASDLEWSEMSDWLIKFIKSHAAAAEVWDNVVVGLQ
jgi:glycosyltransferase involved in cell wall biosynthesis